MKSTISYVVAWASEAIDVLKRSAAGDEEHLQRINAITLEGLVPGISVAIYARKLAKECGSSEAGGYLQIALEELKQKARENESFLQLRLLNELPPQVLGSYVELVDVALRLAKEYDDM